MIFTVPKTTYSDDKEFIDKYNSVSDFLIKLYNTLQINKMKYTHKLISGEYFNYRQMFKEYNLYVAILSIGYIVFCAILINMTIPTDLYRTLKYKFFIS